MQIQKMLSRDQLLILPGGGMEKKEYGVSSEILEWGLKLEYSHLHFKMVILCFSFHYYIFYPIIQPG